MTANEFEQRLNAQIHIVNQTKLILDEPNVNPSTQALKIALCQRLHAYQEIRKLSATNLERDNAVMMNWVAQNYLDKQDLSFKRAGMNQTAFCASTPN